MYEDLEATTCWLIREGGTRWAVRKLDLSGPPPRALVTRGQSEDEEGGGTRELTLVHGDRLEWRCPDGTVAWAMRIPVTTDGSDRGAQQISERREGAA